VELGPPCLGEASALLLAAYPEEHPATAIANRPEDAPMHTEFVCGPNLTSSSAHLVESTNYAT